MDQANAMKSKARQRLDGRHRRSQASRRRIVRAMQDLIEAGNVLPSAEAVARRARVGLRTVFRHFENMESLYREIDSLIAAEVIPIVESPLVSGDWRSQLQEILGRRIRIFERILPFKVAADVHRHTSPFLERQMKSFATLQRATLLPVLPDERKKEPIFVETLDLILSFDTWRRLRKDQKLSSAKARAVLERLLDSAIRQA